MSFFPVSPLRIGGARRGGAGKGLRSFLSCFFGECGDEYVSECSGEVGVELSVYAFDFLGVHMRARTSICF